MIISRHTTVTINASKTVHWGSDCGTMCGAGVGFGKRINLVEAETATCKRCIKLMVVMVELAYEAALTEAAHRADVATVVESGVQVGGAWTATDGGAAVQVSRVESAPFPRVSFHRADGSTGTVPLDQFLARHTPAAALEEAHMEALEHAVIMAFEQELFNELRGEGWSAEDALEMVEGARVTDVPWTDPSDEKKRYDALVRKHAGTVLFRIDQEVTFDQEISKGIETVTTDQLAEGDTVLHYGMVLRLGAPQKFQGWAQRTVYVLVGTVQNRAEVFTPDHVTRGLLKQDGLWTVQGNNLASWTRVKR